MFCISSLSFSGSFLSAESDQNKDGLLVEISRAAALKDKDVSNYWGDAIPSDQTVPCTKNEHIRNYKHMVPNKLKMV